MICLIDGEKKIYNWLGKNSKRVFENIFSIDPPLENTRYMGSEITELRDMQWPRLLFANL